MKKRTIGILIAALLIAVLLTTPVFAGGPSGGDADVQVIAGPITVAGGNDLGGGTYYASDTVTISGTVYIIAVAEGWYGDSEAESTAGRIIIGPNGIIDFDMNSEYDSEDASFWNWYTNADASQVYDWTYELTLSELGDYMIAHGGYGSAEFNSWWYDTFGSDFDYSMIKLHVIKRPKPNIREQPWWYPCNQLFTLGVGGYVQYKWADGFTGPHITPYIEQIGTVQWNGESHLLKVVIDEGTEVTGTPWLSVSYYQGKLILRTFDNQPVIFNPAIHVYVHEGGEWVEIVQ